jgi:pimeloyl-ACP methyl ester carboxylesterase
MPAVPPGRIETLNGTQLYFEVHGSGEPLLLLHGFMGSSLDWSALMDEWRAHFQLIVPDLRGHGRSSNPSPTFRHDESALDIFALLDHLGVHTFKGIGVNGGGNVLLHLATRQPDRVKAMVLVSATSYFPEQARRAMRQYTIDVLPERERENMRRHPHGESQIETLLAQGRAFAESHDDMNFTPPYLSKITANTLVVQGDRDPFYPLEISVEMAKAIPRSSLWVVPNGGHAPIGERLPEFLKTASEFLRQ